MTEPEDRTGTAHPEVAGPGPRVSAAFCPYLGLADDPATHFAFPSTAQRCHSGRRAVEIDLTKQARDCLTAQHVTCSRYRPIPTPGPTQPGRAGVVFRLARPSDLPAPVDPPTAGQMPPTAPGKTKPTLARGLRKRYRAVEGLLVVLLVIAVAAVGIAIGGLLAQQLRDGAGAVATSQDTGPAGSPAPSSVLAPSPQPASPVPGTSDQATETAAPTPTPTATPAPRPVVHVVRRGETLKAIAARYGVTQRSIVRANSLENPSLIAVGQKLVIPSR